MVTCGSSECVRRKIGFFRNYEHRAGGDTFYYEAQTLHRDLSGWEEKEVEPTFDLGKVGEDYCLVSEIDHDSEPAMKLNCTIA